MTNRAKIDITRPVRFVRREFDGEVKPNPNWQGHCYAMLDEELHHWDDCGKAVNSLHDIENYDPSEDPDTQAELERLRAEVAELQEENARLVDVLFAEKTLGTLPSWAEKYLKQRSK